MIITLSIPNTPLRARNREVRTFCLRARKGIEKIHNLSPIPNNSFTYNPKNFHHIQPTLKYPKCRLLWRRHERNAAEWEVGKFDFIILIIYFQTHFTAQIWYTIKYEENCGFDGWEI